MAYKKCSLCGKSIRPTETHVPYKGKFVHDHCFNDAMKALGEGKKAKLAASAEQKAKKKTNAKKTQAELKDGMSEEEYAKKKQYYDYLKTLIDDDKISVKQLAVSERYIDRFNFTFEGMYQCLVYLNEILEKDLHGDIVGIIPYYYTEAAEFYQQLEEINKNSKKLNLNKMYSAKRTVRITPRKRKIKEMNIDEIGDEEK